MTASVVQTASNKGNGTSLTVTLGTDNPTGASGATTAGNYLVVMAETSGSSTNPSTVTAKLGTTSLTAKISDTANQAANQFCFELPNIASGQTVVTVTLAGGSGTIATHAYVYELAGLGTVSAFDKSSFNDPVASGLSFTSNATATTTQAAEIWIGMGFAVQTGSNPTLTGPASLWTNLAGMTQLQGSANTGAVSGYQVVSSTGTATYSGTISTTSFSSAMVATFQAAAGGSSVTGAAATAALAAPAGTVAAGATITGAAATAALAAPAGSVSAGAVIAGAVATLAAAAPAGSVKAGAVVTGAAATSALAAPAGAVAAGAVVTGAAAALTLAAPAGSVSTGSSVSVSGVPATAALAAPAGSVTAGAAVAGAVARVTLAAPAGSAGPPPSGSSSGAFLVFFP